MTNMLTLKILQGLQQGAELRLSAGTWHFGTDPENDLILDDQDVKARHFQLEIDEDGVIRITVKDDARVLINDELVKAENQEVPFFAIIKVGQSQLAIGPEGEAFPEHEVEAEHKVIEAPLPAKARIPLGKVVKRVAGIGALGFLILTGTYMFNRLSFAAPVEHQPEVDVAAVIKHMALDGLRIKDNGQGNTLISGIVSSSHDLTQLKARLYGCPVIFNVHVQDRILASARDIAALYLPGVTVASSEDGGLLLSGLCADGNQLARLITVLREDLPANPVIVNEVKTPQDLYPDLEKILKELRLFKVLTFSVESGHLVVRGAPPAGKMAAWKAARDDFAAAHKIDIVEHFQSQTKPVVRHVKREEPFKIQVLSVSIGDVSYITLEGGAKYFEGATLENGAIVEHIAADHIVLQKSGRKTKFKLGG